MPNTMPSPNAPFIAVDYAAKIVFTPKHDGQEHLDLRATWQQSQGLWKDHPVFHGMLIGEVLTWLRGEDCDV
jgi:hypothetical protein